MIIFQYRFSIMTILDKMLEIEKALIHMRDVYPDNKDHNKYWGNLASHIEDIIKVYEIEKLSKELKMITPDFELEHNLDRFLASEAKELHEFFDARKVPRIEYSEDGLLEDEKGKYYTLPLIDRVISFSEQRLNRWINNNNNIG